MKNFYLFLLFTVCLFITKAQSVSDIVNRYYKVVKVDRDNGWAKLAVADGFLPSYKKAILIQMKGATMNETNSAAFGDITALNNAGNFEEANLCGFMSDTVYFERQLNNFYTDGELIQLVAIPEYSNVTISDTLKGTPWDATTGVGGIIALEATDTLFLDSPIDATGIGFQGGALETFADCTLGGNVTNYYMPYNNGTILAIQGARKGEGITPLITNKEFGRGKQVNGGGGGNHHNAGGGGGSNYGSGGGGGNRTVGGCKSNSPGVGGLSLKSIYDTSRTRLFLGGGGGAGHGNQNTTFGNTGKPGGNGGGLIIITARVIKSNGVSAIIADGARPYNTNTLAIYGNPYDADSDGGGGGGAGGTILLNCTDYNGNTTIEAKGAKGSNVGIGMVSTFCDAPGGGGGGGLIVFSTPVTAAGLTTDVSAGPSGLVLSPAAACHNTPNGATNGVDGNVFFDYTIPAVRDSAPICKFALPVNKLLSFTGKLVNTNVMLTAKVADKNNVEQIIWQRSFNGIDFEDLYAVHNTGREEYTLQDAFQFRAVYYRLSVTNKDGRKYCSTVLKFTGRIPLNQVYVNIYPNPVHSNPIFFFNAAKAQRINFIVYDAAGEKIYSNNLQVNAGENNYPVDLPGLSGGVYYVRFMGDNFTSTKQFVKLR